MKVQYDKEDNVLTIELVRKKIDDAYETENMIVHVDKNREPVLLEIFNASGFLKDLGKAVPKKVQRAISSSAETLSVPHRIK